jgi:hypothetical protein
MKIKIGRYRRHAAGLLAVLSLLVASVSACACTHHHPVEKVEAEEVSSCHKPVHNEKQSQPELMDAADAFCKCVLKTGPRVYAKHENLKIEKQALAASAEDLRPDLVPVTVAAATSNFYSSEIHIAPHYYNYSPGRAPPRL